MENKLKKISIVTPCFNEEFNVGNLYEQVKKIFNNAELSYKYKYEHIFIDNASTDNTVKILKDIAALDKNVKIIVNSRNFGHIRSPFHAIKQVSGDCAIFVVADLQDPPEMIFQFIKKWEEGNEIVIGVKAQSLESKAMFFIRKCYYNLINKLSDIRLVKNYTGFGLYDKKIVALLRDINDPYPYFRGLIFELGFNVVQIPYVQPERKRGITKNNFYTLYDIAMLGICSHSKVPLRLATIFGFLCSIISFLVAIGYFIAKLLLWNSFPLGMAPIVIGLFFFGSVQLFFLGIIGEYIGIVFTKVQNRPLVIEKERINF